jgi:hypothetical protein
MLQERGRELAVRVQNEPGTDGWEVLYTLGGRVHRVHPAASWPAETWEQDLLGYTPRGRRREQKKRPTPSQSSAERQQQSGASGSAPAEP